MIYPASIYQMIINDIALNRCSAFKFENHLGKMKKKIERERI